MDRQEYFAFEVSNFRKLISSYQLIPEVYKNEFHSLILSPPHTAGICLSEIFFFQRQSLRFNMLNLEDCLSKVKVSNLLCTDSVSQKHQKD